MLMTNEIHYMVERFKELHKNYLAEFSYLDRYEFIREFGSLQLSMPRRSGKTTYIKTFADPKLDYIIVPNRESCVDYKHTGLVVLPVTGDFGELRGANAPDNIYLDEVDMYVVEKKLLNVYLEKRTKLISLLTI